MFFPVLLDSRSPTVISSWTLCGQRAKVSQKHPTLQLLSSDIFLSFNTKKTRGHTLIFCIECKNLSGIWGTPIEGFNLNLQGRGGGNRCSKISGRGRIVPTPPLFLWKHLFPNHPYCPQTALVFFFQLQQGRAGLEFGLAFCIVFRFSACCDLITHAWRCLVAVGEEGLVDGDNRVLSLIAHFVFRAQQYNALPSTCLTPRSWEI